MLRHPYLNEYQSYGELYVRVYQHPIVFDTRGIFLLEKEFIGVVKVKADM